MLLDSASVRRVSETGEAARDVAAWAGRDLPSLDLSRMLGGGRLDRSGGVLIIYAAGDDDGGAVVLAVDEVKGLVTLGPNALARLPPISDRFAQLFDAIAVEPIDGRHPLCLRARLDIGAIEREDA
jgi:chemotaxis signal transduction protein